jgi:tetratricopeptide (TPR) repeat protein
MRFDLRSLRRSLAYSTGISAALFVSTRAFSQETPTPPQDTTATGTPAEGTEGTPDATQITPEQLKELIEKGEAALKAKDYQAALKTFNECLRAGSQVGDGGAVVMAYSGRGRAFAGLKEYDAAQSDFKEVTSLVPNHGPTLIARGNVYMEQGDPEMAKADFEAVYKADQGNIEAQLGLGKALVALRRSDEAIKPLTSVIAADPNNAEALRTRAVGYAGVFKTKQAFDDVQKAIAADPADHESYSVLGQLHVRNEEYQPAIDALTKALENYKPKDGKEDEPYWEGYIALANAYIELGKTSKDEAASTAAYKAAIGIDDKVISLTDSKNPFHGQARAFAFYNRGIAERQLGQYGTAIRSLTQAIELVPDLGDAYFRRGICFHLLNEHRMAITDFEYAAHMTDDDPRANLWVGMTYANMGEYHKALRAYGDAIAVSDRYTPAYINRGMAYLALGQYEKAANDFSEAIRLEPTNGEYYYKRGRAYEQMGDNKRASESYATAIEFDGKHAEAYRHMGAAMQAQGRPELAAEYTKKADELAPPKPQK